MACSKKEVGPVATTSASASPSAAPSVAAAPSASVDKDDEKEPEKDVSSAPFVLPEAGVADKKVRHVKLEPGQLAKILAGFPETKRIGDSIRYFTEGDIHAIQNRSSVPHDDVMFSTQPVVWSPEGDAEYLLAVGRGKSSSFIVVLEPKPDGGFGLVSSFIMLNDLSPVTLAWDPKSRRDMRWTSCWGCNGEDGLVSWRPEEKRVVIVQR